MKEKQIRLLRADEIECRVGTITDKGLSLLLYKDARVDMNLLNETFSPMGWKKSYQSINGELFCTIEVFDENKQQWIGKQDIGTPSFSESEKGRASDAFKRSAFCWGSGIELYSAPFMWLSSDKYKATKTDKGYKVKDTFHVEHIAYNDNREISEITVVNQNGIKVFEMKAKKVRKKQEDFQLTVEQTSELTNEMKRTGVTLEAVLSRYGLSSLNEMNQT